MDNEGMTADWERVMQHHRELAAAFVDPVMIEMRMQALMLIRDWCENDPSAVNHRSRPRVNRADFGMGAIVSDYVDSRGFSQDPDIQRVQLSFEG